MIVTLSSTRGSPGVTSWSLLLASAWPTASDWPGDGRVVLEADPAGGVLGARYGLGVDPGVVSLIASLRRDDTTVDVAAHGRVVAGGLVVVPGPESGEQARSVWQDTAVGVMERLESDPRLWVIDAGRLDASSPVVCCGWLSTLTVVLCGDAVEDLVQVPARVAWLQARHATVGVLVVGKPQHSMRELGEFFGTGLVWSVGASRDVREIAGAALATPVRARHSWVWRCALDLAADMAAHAQPAPVAGDRERVVR